MPDYGLPLFTKVPSQPRDASGILKVDRDTFYGLKSRDYQKTKADIGTLSIDHQISENLGVRQVLRYSKTLNDYILTNPGDAGPAQFINGVWWMKRGPKTRWNPTTTLAAVTDLHGKITTGAVEHSFDVGVELSREKNLNATYSTFTTSGAACPTGYVWTGTFKANLGEGDCTNVFAPNANDPWTGVVNRAPANYNISKTAAIYAFDTLKFGDKWLLNLGVRHDNYQSLGHDYTLSQAQGVFTVTGITYRDAEWSFTNYQAGLVYKPTEDSSVYISYGTASTPPGISAGDQNSNGNNGTGNLANTVLEPEDSESFELGAKVNVFNDALALSAALFKTTRKNAQIQIDAGVYAQVGETQVQGVELGVSGNITPKWQAFGGYTYMDSELVRGAYNGVNQGDPLANTPENTFSLFTTYRVIRPLSLGGGAYYVSKTFGGNQGGAGGGANGIYLPAYWRYDAFASYTINDKMDLQLNVQNLTDERYFTKTNGTHHADPAPGRQAILTLNVKY
jgi:catecholate siderophore receptor